MSGGQAFGHVVDNAWRLEIWANLYGLSVTWQAVADRITWAQASELGLRAKAQIDRALVKANARAMHMDRVHLISHVGDKDCCVVHDLR